MRVSYYLALMRVEFYFRGARTLKDRRKHLNSVRDRLSNLGFSVAQVGPVELASQAFLVAVASSGSVSMAEKILERAERVVHGPEWELACLTKDIIGENEELPEWEAV